MSHQSVNTGRHLEAKGELGFWLGPKIHFHVVIIIQCLCEKLRGW